MINTQLRPHRRESGGLAQVPLLFCCLVRLGDRLLALQSITSTGPVKSSESAPEAPEFCWCYRQAERSPSEEVGHTADNVETAVCQRLGDLPSAVPVEEVGVQTLAMGESAEAFQSKRASATASVVP